jgi:hypothetical protein
MIHRLEGARRRSHRRRVQLPDLPAEEPKWPA